MLVGAAANERGIVRAVGAGWYSTHSDRGFRLKVEQKRERKERRGRRREGETEGKRY